LKFSFGINEERSNRSGGVLFLGGEESGEVGGRENGVVINNEEVGEGGKLFECVLASKGETATKAEVFPWRKVVRRKGGIFYRVGGSGVGPVIAYNGGSWAKGLRGEGVEKAGKE